MWHLYTNKTKSRIDMQTSWNIWQNIRPGGIYCVQFSAIQGNIIFIESLSFATEEEALNKIQKIFERMWDSIYPTNRSSMFASEFLFLKVKLILYGSIEMIMIIIVTSVIINDEEIFFRWLWGPLIQISGFSWISETWHCSPTRHGICLFFYTGTIFISDATPPDLLNLSNVEVKRPSDVELSLWTFVLRALRPIRPADSCIRCACSYIVVVRPC